MAHSDDSSAEHAAHRDRTPPAGTVTLDERLRGIEQMLRDLVESIGKAVNGHDTLNLRVAQLERVVYSGVAIALLAVASAVLALVLRATPANHEPNVTTTEAHP